MAGCFDFSQRSGSVDSKSASVQQTNTLKKFLNVFRSKSDSNIKPESPSKAKVVKSTSLSGATGGTAQPQRRYKRVVRRDTPPAGDENNPHVKTVVSRKGLAAYHNAKSDNELSRSVPRPPCDGDIFLKKSSTDPTYGHSTPMTGKHATFKDVVEVVEYRDLDLVETLTGFALPQRARLRDSDESMEGGRALVDEQKEGFFLKGHSDEDDDDEVDDVDDEGDKEMAATDSAKATVEVRKPIKTTLDLSSGVMRNVFAPIVSMDIAASLSSEPAQLKRTKGGELTDVLRHNEFLQEKTTHKET